MSHLKQQISVTSRQLGPKKVPRNSQLSEEPLLVVLFLAGIWGKNYRPQKRSREGCPATQAYRREACEPEGSPTARPRI